MKIPHALFVIINKIMRLLLRSPLHGLFSSSILAIGYKGRRSGRQIWVPARYLQRGDGFALVTSKDTKWWPNFTDGLDAKVLLKGAERNAHVLAITNDPEAIGQAMRDLWARHPSDAAYMEVRVRDGEPDEADFRRALAQGVLVTVELRD